MLIYNSELTQKDARGKKTANLELQAPGGGGRREGDSHIKVTGILDVSLWGENCRFWSHLGSLGGKSLHSPMQV